MGTRRVFYLETLKRQLPRIAEGGSLASVLEHCMYCGMSLGRVGLDFRGLLVPVFEREVLRLFSTSVKVRSRPDSGTQRVAVGLPSRSRKRVELSLAPAASWCPSWCALGASSVHANGTAFPVRKVRQWHA